MSPALGEEKGTTVDVTLEAELNDLRWVCKEMTHTVFLNGCHHSAWKDEGTHRVTVPQPQSQIAFYLRALFPHWTDLIYSLPDCTLTGEAPCTAPWWKWFGNRILGIGALPLIDVNDPEIQYAHLYGSDAAAE